MTPAIAALAASLLLISTTSAEAQEPAGAGGTVGAQAPPDQRQPDARPADKPNLRDQLLQGAINVLLNPRPKPAPPQVEPAPVGPAPAAVIEPPIEAPTAGVVEPSPPAPRPVSVVPPTPAVVPTKPAPTPRGTPSSASPPPIEPSSAPAPITEPVDPAPPAAVPLAAEPSPVVIETVEPTPTPALDAARPSANSNWLLLGLLAVAAVVAATVRLRRIRQIARTRAALSLNPSLDLAAGACSLNRLVLAGPPLTIRARLDVGEVLVG